MTTYQVTKNDPRDFGKMRQYTQQGGYLPTGKYIFEKYHDYGDAITWRKLQAILTREGYRNPRTGNSPSLMGLNFAYWRYALANPVESFEYAKSHPIRLEKDFVTLADWYQHLYQKMHTTIYTDGQRARWLEKNTSVIEIVPNEETKE